MIFLILCFSVGAFAVTGIECCDMIQRDKLLECFSELVDTNSDSILTPAELTTYFAAQNAPFPANMTARVMTSCDMNLDNQLTLDDWTNSTGCCREEVTIKRTCYACFMSRWTGPS